MDSRIKRLQNCEQIGSQILDTSPRWARLASKLIFFIYRYIAAPFMHAIGGAGFGCRYSPSCSHYAEGAFRTYPLSKALKLSFLRVIRCNPWINAPYFDPVPPSPRKVHT